MLTNDAKPVELQLDSLLLVTATWCMLLVLLCLVLPWLFCSAILLLSAAIQSSIPPHPQPPHVSSKTELDTKSASTLLNRYSANFAKNCVL